MSTSHQEEIKDGEGRPIEENYVACMILGAVGDSLAYRNGDWEFLGDGKEIHRQIEEMGGIDRLSQESLIVSDDTVMHLATAEGFIEAHKQQGNLEDFNELFQHIAKKYVDCMDDMNGRAPGGTCIRGAEQLRPFEKDGHVIPFRKFSGGCGAAMRSMCIGLVYWSEKDEDKLIEVSIESGRMTHNCPNGYLGSLASALFTAYAVRHVPPIEWGRRLMKILPKALEYVCKIGRDVRETHENWGYFTDSWKKYLETRQIDKDQDHPTFPEQYGVLERDQFYESVSLRGWGGSSGHDAPMIAYDAYLGANGNWIELAKRGFFHGGDSDSTAIIAACWHGARYGFNTVPILNVKDVEKENHLKIAAKKLFEIATQN